MTQSSADRLIEDRYVKDYMVAIMREVLAIGRAVGVDADIDPEARIDMARSLGKFKTSMLQDLEAGKTLEVDGLLAGTLEIARIAGVPAPSSASAMRRMRPSSLPPGSPTISRVPWLWLTSPGSGVDAARCTTQPTMRSVGMARDSAPPGSRLSRCSLPAP
ncbi:MAG: ketopantoate reductase C-terminal domain-containing protein [bacterium]